MNDVAMVTGAFGYTGARIAAKLLDSGWTVRTLTNHPERALEPTPIEPFPLAFEDPESLVESLSGADVLFNTYWVRFARGETTFDRAVRNTLLLFDAARRAGVRRIVHISITNPEHGTGLPYFEGKAVLERVLRASGTSHAIVRPTVMFGHGDVFVNNIAWLLRRFPFFVVPGSGTYRLQPVFVDDVADICVEAGTIERDLVVDAAGPEVFTFEGMLGCIQDVIGIRRRLVHASSAIALLFARMIGPFVGDVVLTRHELEGLMRELIVASSDGPGTTRFTSWLMENRGTLGTHYASELQRNYGPRSRRVAVR